MPTPKGYTTPELVQDELGRTFDQTQTDQCNLLIWQAEDWVDRYTARAWLEDVARGPRGAVYTSQWVWDIQTYLPPAAGQLRSDTSIWQTATRLHLSRWDASGADLSNALRALLVVGEELRLEAPLADGGPWATFGIVAAAIDQGDWFEVPVTNVGTSAGMASNGTTVDVSVLSGDDSGGEPSDDLPGTIQRATTLLVADAMETRLAGAAAGQSGLSGIESYSIGGELSVKLKPTWTSATTSGNWGAAPPNWGGGPRSAEASRLLSAYEKILFA